MKKSKFTKIILIIFFLTIGLNGCVNNPTSLPQPTNTDLVVQTPLETPTLLPTTETATVEIPKHIFIHLTNSDFYFPDQTAFTQLIATMMEIGYEVSLSSDIPDSNQQFSFVILFEPTQETISRFQANKVDRFLIVQENIEMQTEYPTTLIEMSIADRLFIAGYLAAMISNDWRVGGLLPAIDYQNTGAAKIFQNGVEFMCGRCSPTYGPIVNFPATNTVSSPEDNDRTLQAFGEISANKINTLFIPSAYLSEDLVILLQQSGVTIVSDTVPSPDRMDWIDYAIVDNLLSLILESINEPEQPEGLKTIAVNYSVEAITTELSPGKKDFIKKMINNLQDGFISPYQVSTE